MRADRADLRGRHADADFERHHRLRMLDVDITLQARIACDWDWSNAPIGSTTGGRRPGGACRRARFWNIRDGRRDRTAAYAEWEHHLGPRWTAELGVRYERVRMDAGPVQATTPRAT